MSGIPKKSGTIGWVLALHCAPTTLWGDVSSRLNTKVIYQEATSVTLNSFNMEDLSLDDVGKIGELISGFKTDSKRKKYHETQTHDDSDKNVSILII